MSVIVLMAFLMLILPAEAYGKAQDNYFPKEMEKSLFKYEIPLRRLSAPSLWKHSHSFPVYRLTFNRRVGHWETITFHANPRSPRIIVRMGNLVTAKPTIFAYDFALTSDAREKFHSEIKATGFWNCPTFSDIFGTTPKALRDDVLDAEPWIVEGVDENRYHVVKRGWTKVDSCSRLKEIFYNQTKKFDAYKR